MGSQTNNLCTPFYEPSSRITGRAFGAPVVGKRFVMVAGKKDPGSAGLDAGATGGNVLIGPATAAADATLGVAEHDAAIGKTTTVFTGGFTVPITAGAAITAGALINAGANGKAAVAANIGAAKGLALSDAAVDADCVVKLF